MQSNRLVTEREAAALIGLSVSTLQMRRHRSLPPIYVKIGRSVRYETDALTKFVEACRVEAGGKAA